MPERSASESVGPGMLALAVRKPIAILIICQIMLTAAGSNILAFSTLVGHQLAPSPVWSTLPHALLSVVSAVVALPISMMMLRFGRRAGFLVGAAAGTLSGFVAYLGVDTSSFVMLCVGTALFGLYQTSGDYYRFGAAERVGEASRNDAISLVIGSGIIGISIGPWIGQTVGPAVDVSTFAGLYLAIAVLSIGAFLLLLLDDSVVKAGKHNVRSKEPVGHAARLDFAATTAIVNGAVAFGVMVAVMVASPLAIVAAGHSVAHSSAVIQLHLLGMFLPSLVSGRVTSRFGPNGAMLLGLFVLSCSLVLASIAYGIISFLAALALLGIGWNFTLVGSTAVLTAIAEPVTRARAQGVSQLVTSVVVTLSIFGAGVIYDLGGWLMVVAFAVLPLVVGIVLTLRASRGRPHAADSPSRVPYGGG